MLLPIVKAMEYSTDREPLDMSTNGSLRPCWPGNTSRVSSMAPNTLLSIFICLPLRKMVRTPTQNPMTDGSLRSLIRASIDGFIPRSSPVIFARHSIPREPWFGISPWAWERRTSHPLLAKFLNTPCLYAHYVFVEYLHVLAAKSHRFDNLQPLACYGYPPGESLGHS